jgi:hypothetical protein
VDLSNSPETTLRDFLFQISPKGTGKGSRVDSLNLAEYDPTEPAEDAFDHPAAPEQSEDFFCKKLRPDLTVPSESKLFVERLKFGRVDVPMLFSPQYLRDTKTDRMRK